MDLRNYFQKRRDIEFALTDAFPLIISLATEDGGRSGVAIEVPKQLAAKLIVEGRAVLATEAEKQDYLEAQSRAKEVAKQAELAKRVQVAIIADSELPKHMPGKVGK